MIGGDPEPRWAQVEVAYAMTWTTTAASVQLSLADDLVTRLPAVFTALDHGEIDAPKARVMSDLTLCLPTSTTKGSDAPMDVPHLGRASRSACGRVSNIGLRPATPADNELCYQLHRAAMRGYVEAIWGWDEGAQRDHHGRGFDPAHTKVVTVDGHDAGVLVVDHRPTEIYLGRIELHPDYQGQGIGSRLIQRLLHEAASRHQPVTLDVLTVNPRAYQLYQRLGFQEVGRHGENNTKIRMRAEPLPT